MTDRLPDNQVPDRPPDERTRDGGTPEGHTPEQPAPSELGEPGTPGAGLTGAVPHHADAEAVEHGEHAPDGFQHDTATHMDAHAGVSDDDHGHAEPRVGPIDVKAWVYGLVGIVAGAIVVAAFWIAVYGRPT